VILPVQCRSCIHQRVTPAVGRRHEEKLPVRDITSGRYTGSFLSKAKPDRQGIVIGA